MDAERRAARDRVSAEPCRCVRCGDCGGSGRVSVRTDSYPEWDLESCEECGGSGIVETCDRCELLEEMDDAD